MIKKSKKQTHKIHNMTIEEYLATQTDPADLFMASLSDPPYGLNFMGKAWDHGVPGQEIWGGIKGKLLPGSNVMAFGGTRTFHRLAVGIEDGGLEIRDVLMYLYSSGFPKSHDLSKAIDKKLGTERPVVGEIEFPYHNKPNGRSFKHVQGTPDKAVVTQAGSPQAQEFDGYGTAVKPAYEPIIWAMKENQNSFADNALTHGVAGINIDGSRVAHNEPCKPMKPQQKTNGMFAQSPRRTDTTELKEGGRWPSNVIYDGSDELEAEFAKYGESRSQSGGKTGLQNEYVNGKVEHYIPRTGYDDEGSIARFFYCAKPSNHERDAGVMDDPVKKGSMFGNDGARPHTDPDYVYEGESKNYHPTVKPITLCTYLAKMILPPYTGRTRRILVPFSGSGSEMIGCLLAGWDEVVGVEMDKSYVNIAEQRIAWWYNQALRLQTTDVKAILKADRTAKEADVLMSIFESL